MRYFTLAIALLSLSSGMLCVLAQTPDVVPAPAPRPSGLQTVSSIIGSRVQVSGTAYGTVSDIVLNDAGCLEYVVVSNGDAYYVAPWGLTQYDGGAHVITIPAPVSTLEQTRWSRAEWPAVSYGVLNERVGRAWPSGRVRGVDRGPGPVPAPGPRGKRALPGPVPVPAPQP